MAPSALEILVRILGVYRFDRHGIDFWYRPPQTHARMATAHRRFLNLHDRTFGTGGAAQLVHRPWRAGTLRDGESVQLDAILADQASQLAHVVADLSTDDSQFPVSSTSEPWVVYRCRPDHLSGSETLVYGSAVATCRQH